MRDYIKSIVDAKRTPEENLNRVREYIQAYFLYVIYRKKYYQDMVFTGGTALRFVHRIRRFSEDIDFSLSQKATNFDFAAMLAGVVHEFQLAGYSIEAKPKKAQKAVHGAMLKFSGILFEAGISPLKDEKLAIKVEIDTRPPAGGVETSSMVNSPFLFSTQHYDLSSLFAGKIHAVLCREYAKGRDWYDLLWYLSMTQKGIEPNFTMLNNALAQTEKKPARLDSATWKEALKEAVAKADFKQIRADVRRFLEMPSEVEFLEAKTFDNLLKEGPK